MKKCEREGARESERGGRQKKERAMTPADPWRAIGRGEQCCLPPSEPRSGPSALGINKPFSQCYIRYANSSTRFVEFAGPRLADRSYRIKSDTLRRSSPFARSCESVLEKGPGGFSREVCEARSRSFCCAGNFVILTRKRDLIDSGEIMFYFTV